MQINEGSLTLKVQLSKMQLLCNSLEPGISDGIITHLRYRPLRRVSHAAGVLCLRMRVTSNTSIYYNVYV